jgi:hypothetical protein
VVVNPDIASKLGISGEELDVIEVEHAPGTTHGYITRRKYLVELLDDTIYARLHSCRPIPHGAVDDRCHNR